MLYHGKTKIKNLNAPALPRDIENIFSKADFSSGSDHKKRLAETLFGNAGETSDSIRILSDDELDMVSAAGGIAERHNFLNQ